MLSALRLPNIFHSMSTNFIKFFLRSAFSQNDDQALLGSFYVTLTLTLWEQKLSCIKKFIFYYLCTPHKIFTFYLCKTPSSLEAHYASGFTTISVCAFFMVLLLLRFANRSDHCRQPL